MKQVTAGWLCHMQIMVGGRHITSRLPTCIVPTKMLIDMKPCDLDTLMISGTRTRAARSPMV